MKNKEKFVKIANIIYKVFIGIMIALLVLCVGVVCFRACSADKQVAYASQSDGVGIWVWNSSFIEQPFDGGYLFDFVSNGLYFNRITCQGFTSPEGVVFSMNYVPDSGEAVLVLSETGWVVDFYRTIDIKTAPPADFLTILQANATYQVGTTPEPVESYNLYVQLTNGVDKTLTIDTSAPLSVQLEPQSGYGYPTSVSVVNATLDSYNAETGVAVVSSPTANCYISGLCPLLVNPTNVVRGIYTFINTLSGGPTNTVHQSVNFTTVNNGVVSSWSGIDFHTDLVSYTRSGSTGGTSVYSSSAVGSLRAGWQSPQYQVINFGDTYQDVSPEFYNWLVANTVPPDVQNSESYQLGYNAGLAVGQTAGYNTGYTAGQSYGYNQGYQAGLADGSSSVIHGSEDIISGTASLFAIKIFGTFSMLDCFLVIFGIGVCIWFLKMFAGG